MVKHFKSIKIKIKGDSNVCSEKDDKIHMWYRGEPTPKAEPRFHMHSSGEAKIIKHGHNTHPKCLMYWF